MRPLLLLLLLLSISILHYLLLHDQLMEVISPNHKCMQIKIEAKGGGDTGCHIPGGRSGFGLMFFVYGPDVDTANKFMKQVEKSVRRIRSIEPGIKVGAYIMEGVRTTDEVKLFDFMGLIPSERVYGGRQWGTRIEFMMCTPFEVTLALDATAMVCEGGGLEDALEEYAKSDGKFDIAFNSKYSLNLKDTRNVVDKSDGYFYPHNWAIIYTWNARIEGLFRHWSKVHSCIENKSSGTGTDDQYTLFQAIRGFTKEEEGLKVGRLSNGFAAAYVESEPGMGEDKRWRATQEISGGSPCRLTHAGDSRMCSFCNKEVESSRVLVEIFDQAPRVAYNQSKLDALTRGRGLEMGWKGGQNKVAYDWKEEYRREIKKTKIGWGGWT